VISAEGMLEFAIANGTYINTIYEVQFNLTSPVDNTGFPRNVSIGGFGESLASCSFRLFSLVQASFPSSQLPVSVFILLPLTQCLWRVRSQRNNLDLHKPAPVSYASTSSGVEFCPGLTCARTPVESGTYDAPIYLSEMVQSTDSIYGIDGASAPLFTYQVLLARLQFCQIVCSCTSRSHTGEGGKSF
jgi:hypothetical protein